VEISYLMEVGCLGVCVCVCARACARTGDIPQKCTICNIKLLDIKRERVEVLAV